LFQGRFEAKWVDRDAYLLHLTRCIHLNPVAAGLVGRAHVWPYPSYAEYIGVRERAIVRPENVLAQLGTHPRAAADVCAAYAQFVEESIHDDGAIRHLIFEE
jgi:hypothetical protein